MTSAPVRDPLADHLITPQNAALLLIDYQPAQLAGVRSMDRALLVKNAVSTVSTIKTFAVPVVHSTINVATGRGQPTLPELADLLTDDKPLDRTTTNSWEDIEFVQAVHATPQDAGVAAAAVTVGQMLGGSVGTSPLNTIFASAVASYLTAHLALAGSSAAKP
jgi:Isochorismatase family